ncbi:hypothetical protein XBFM1_810012 [Xenorhabdus bovienii str. feltiae Moldova]|uniref:Uncharacterized protein n=2 Tax=Xenorhabdus bovienii TaxID=40576 RepID=A0A0B6XD48_XENBV|nr:hypothetical protein XBFM1_810012 [Xenorhabdus bovienii str. feltiae Moldova]CDM91500.1 protein of unknown function [Xenorhabdus bovienii]
MDSLDAKTTQCWVYALSITTTIIFYDDDNNNLGNFVGVGAETVSGVFSTSGHF